MTTSNSRNVLVSGCSRGLGRLLAETLCRHGFTVYAGIRQEADIIALNEAWKKEELDIRIVRLDVLSDDDCHQAVDNVLKKEGHLDVLINCAATVLAGPGENYSAADFLRLLDINAVGPFRLIKESILPMRSQGGGRVINISSLNGRVSLPGFSLYGASKHALEALGLSLYYELKKSNIYLTNVAPGAIRDKQDHTGSLNHVPVRERFLFMKMLLPMLDREAVVKEIEKIINDPRPAPQIILGRDAKITLFLNRYLPLILWKRLLLILYG